MAIAEWRQQLQHVVGDSLTIPAHALHRLEVMVSGESVGWVDGCLHPVDVGKYDGKLVVFTDDRVVLATLDGAGAPDQFLRDTTYTVHVETWARRSLTRAAMVATPGVRRAYGNNPDDRWHQPSGDWPTDGYIRLQYEGGQQIELPLTAMKPKRAQEFKALVPRLLHDMIRE